MKLQVKKYMETLLLAVSLILYCCGDKSSRQPGQRQAAASNIDSVVMHHWDKFIFSDTASLEQKPEKAEQLLADYIYNLSYVSTQTTKSSIEALVDKAADYKPSFDWFAEKFDQYLYDPNSPYRDEETYAIVLENIIASPEIDSLDKLRPAYQLGQINTNRRGDIAADLVYSLPDGKRGRLYDIKADYTLIFFYDPDCGTCYEMKQQLEASHMVSAMLQNGKLAIVAFCFEKGIDKWKDRVKTIPDNWINGYDFGQDVNERGLYVLRATPTLYLLDKDKRVELKDCSVEQLEQALINI